MSPQETPSISQPQDKQLVLEGGCACGHIRYRAHGLPLITHCCHCTDCQRESGSAFAINGLYLRRNVFRSASKPYTGIIVDKNDKEGSKASEWEEGKATAALAAVSLDDDFDEEVPLIDTPAASGFPQRIARCPKCHVAVWSHYFGNDATLTFLKCGTLDEAVKVNIVPDVHIYTRSKVPWVVLPEGAEVYEEFYDMRQKFKDAGEGSDRCEALGEIAEGAEREMKKLSERKEKDRTS